MIHITHYTPSQFDEATTIFTELSRYYLQDNASDRDTVAENLRRNILAEHSSMSVLLAYHEESVCGLAAYTIMYPATKETGQLFLKELFIQPQFSRKGIGEALMAYLANIALERNCSRFDWTSNSDSVKATQFYQKIGAPVIEKKQYYRLSGEKLKEMAKGARTSKK